MNTLTSMADFYRRVKLDKIYELLAIRAYRESNHFRDAANNVTYEESINWINSWIKDYRNRKEDPENCTCHTMVEYLNKVLSKMPTELFTSKLISPNNINIHLSKS